MKNYWVYILKCRDGSFYTGSTSDLEKRLSEHNHGIIDCYTKSRLPVKLVYSYQFAEPYESIKSERQIKGWSRAKKLALINNEIEILHFLSECKNGSNYKIMTNILTLRLRSGGQ